MARPSKFNRQEAIEFAMNEIWRDGYSPNSVKALSEKMGITRSSFYNAFCSRESLFNEVLALYLSRSPDVAFLDTHSCPSIKSLVSKTFRNICKTRAEDVEGRGCLLINSVTSELYRSNDLIKTMLDEVFKGRTEAMQRLLKQAVAQNEIDQKTDLYVLGLSLQNLLVGINVMSKVVSQEDDLWQIARATLIGLNMHEEIEL